MVKLQEVEDEHFVDEQPGPKDEEAEFIDTDSEISSDEDSDDEDTFEETVYERLVALKDMVPPKHRAKISGAFNATYSLITKSLLFGGSALWVLSSSAIMIGVPYALAVGEDQQMAEMEKEMMAQQIASQGLTSGNLDGKPGQAVPQLPK